jgi:hypothetical protein
MTTVKEKSEFRTSLELLDDATHLGLGELALLSLEGGYSQIPDASTPKQKQESLLLSVESRINEQRFDRQHHLVKTW